MQALSAGIPRSVQCLDRVMRKSAVAALAGTGLLLAASATHAVTIYSGPVNLAIPATTNGLYLNVVTGANNLPASGAGSTVSGWDINLWSTTGLGFFNASAPAGGSYVITTVGIVTNLAPGAVIGSASSYGSGTSTNTSQWTLNSTSNLFGFRFLNEADGLTYYGWGRISLSVPIAGTRSLVEYAYESVAGASIAAGFTGVVPEPGTYAMMGAGVVALALARRRRRA